MAKEMIIQPINGSSSYDNYMSPSMVKWS